MTSFDEKAFPLPDGNEAQLQANLVTHQSFEELNDVSSAQELFAITKKLSLASDEEWRQ
jgi:hypothetical protein